MTAITLSPLDSISNDGIMKASRESIDVADDTSESDSTCNESSEDESRPRQALKKSVRFSLVQTREYGVVDEFGSPLDDGSEPVRRSLGWDYVERESDLEAHMNEMEKERKEHHLLLIQHHIRRAEREREEREKNKRTRKRKGFGSKIIKPLWKGFLASGHRSTMVMSSPYA